MALRRCPACRLPAPPAAILTGATEGVHVVFGICRDCAGRYARLPRATATKLLAGAVARAGADTERYWCACFPDRGAALLAQRMVRHPDTANGALEAFGWK